MSKKRVLQKIAGSMLLASIVVGGYMGTAYAEAPDVSNGESAVFSYETPGNNSREAQLVWISKEVNGLKFIRLYDATNEKWVGPWIWVP